ncbi:hypothetical protein C0V72_10520 [Porphyrobacter sp. TH134]|uniref:hypothetical protein n=1 Tax=Porphyrobacter sp. TH134 TaxID=2067450 RepID=UPI000C7DE17D|nr:hypothetical protein [Porphyrobacter sp. TH134]PLK23288.1 hypothetical protein C0V72_10520 [Porphyrobacter sp. TH134]
MIPIHHLVCADDSAAATTDSPPPGSDLFYRAAMEHQASGPNRQVTSVQAGVIARSGRIPLIRIGALFVD